MTEQPTEPEVPEPFFWTCPDFATNKDKPFDRIRKDYNELTGPERELYIQAINTAKERGYYDMFVAIHKYQTNDDYAHGTSVMLERLLKSYVKLTLQHRYDVVLRLASQVPCRVREHAAQYGSQVQVCHNSLLGLGTGVQGLCHQRWRRTVRTRFFGSRSRRP